MQYLHMTQYNGAVQYTWTLIQYCHLWNIQVQVIHTSPYNIRWKIVCRTPAARLVHFSTTQQYLPYIVARSMLLVKQYTEPKWRFMLFGLHVLNWQKEHNNVVLSQNTR